MEKQNNVTLSFLFCFIYIFISGCSLDYSTAMIPEDLSEKVPETIFINFYKIRIKDGRVFNKIEAEKAENYTKKKHMVLENVKFTELDKTGEVVTQGRADKAVIYTETDDSDISGNIYFYSLTEETEIFAENLFWKDESRKLSAKPDDLVVVKKDDGSYIQGKGFRTDFRLREIVFTNGVVGKYMKEDDNDSSEESSE